ncbi:MAG: LacI family DNA-binding transcriptional regulator [Lachnospiraceae bacterium]|nr:LacI family DNA-binding transcriptional regulator [Lachnospiraceae bacterium]
MAATILDVSKLCGYSKATVSRAFASPEKVKEKTREKIYQAAQTLNYTPDAIARAMVRGRTDNIGFIIYEKQYPVVLNPFYSPIFESVLQTCTRRGYSLFISSDRELRLPNGQTCVKKQLDGVILAGHSDERIVNDLRRQNMPVVLLNNRLDMEGLLCVTTDQYGGGMLAMEHLLERGHRKIGLLAGEFSPHVYNSRYKAYCDALTKAGCLPEDRYIRRVEPVTEHAIEAAMELLNGKDRVTAIFATNDTIAIGAMKAAIRMGLRIPQDIAVVGYDDSENSRMIEPELTTVRVDKASMGRIAAERLISQIEGEEPCRDTIQTSVELVIRGST